MTELTITPDVAKKRLKLAGVVASGEKVAVTIVGFGETPTANLRLRAMAGVVPVGMFPLEDDDEWTVSDTDLTCTLNLATEQAERHCAFGAEVCFILEDTGTPQLYGAGLFELRPWVKLAGDDVPVNLADYRTRIEAIEEAVSRNAGEIALHTQNTGNPHGVTAVQVGLGNVDNTADVNKPVSNAQREAINEVLAAVQAEAASRAAGDAPLSGQTINTNTANAMRQAIKTIGAALGATMRVVAACAALPLFGASVQTAPFGELDLDTNPRVVTNVDLSGLLTEHQDISGKADKTNTYTKGETDARIVELSPRTSLEPATNYVNDLERRIADGLLKAGTAGQADRAYEADTASSAGRADSADLAMNAIEADNATWADHAYYLDDGTHQLTATDLMNAIPDVNNLATKSELEAVSNEAQVVYRLFSGSNVVDEVTNYNSSVRLPSRRMYQLSESNTYFKVWDEMDQHTNTLGQAKRYTDEKMAALPGEFAPRAWSCVTSGLGMEAPSNTTWISTPTTVIAGGYEPSKYITSGGAVWLITSKGATYDFSPSTNNTAYLNISAQDGVPMFRIEKTDAYLVGVNATGVTVENGNTLVVNVDIVAADHPLVRVKGELTDATWEKEEDGIPSALATVAWSGSTGNYTCRITNNTGGSSLFAYFEYLQEGGTKIVNQAAMDVSAGILCTDGIHKVRPVYTNGVITWEVVR